MDAEGQSIITEMSREIDGLKNSNTQLQGAFAGSSFMQNTENPISYQLDTAEIKNQLEHFLKGDYISIDEETKEEVWVTQTDEDKIYFNEYGISAIMSKISLYLDKMTFLSNNSEMRIYEILSDFGDYLADFIYHNYEKMGMNSEFKKTNYELIVVSLLHTIENAYKRSLQGKTLDIINSSRLYMENNGNKQAQAGQPKKWNLFKPSTW